MVWVRSAKNAMWELWEQLNMAVALRASDICYSLSRIPPPPSSPICRLPVLSLLLLLLLINARSMFLQVWSECTAEQVDIDIANNNNLTESRGLAIILYQRDCYKRVVTYVYLLSFYFTLI